MNCDGERSRNNNVLPRAQTLVDSRSVAEASLHVPLPLKWHIYVWPFASMLYPVWIYIYFFKYDAYLGSEEWTFVSLGSIITLHALSFLVCQWSVTLKALFTCVKVGLFERWTNQRKKSFDTEDDDRRMMFVRPRLSRSYLFVTKALGLFVKYIMARSGLRKGYDCGTKIKLMRDMYAKGRYTLLLSTKQVHLES